MVGSLRNYRKIDNFRTLNYNMRGMWLNINMLMAFQMKRLNSFHKIYYTRTESNYLLHRLLIYSHLEVFRHVLCKQASPPVLRQRIQSGFPQLFLGDLEMLSK